MRNWFVPRSGLEAPLLSKREIQELLSADSCRLSVVNRQTPRQGQSGPVLAAQKGAGTDIADLRSYQPGDSPRTIDWRASAKSREILVRSYFSEQSKPLFVLLDRGQSMRFGSRVRPKAAQAARVAISLAAGEAKAGHEYAAIFLDEPCHWLPPGRGTRQLEHFIEMANAACPPDPQSQLSQPWDKLLPTLWQRLPQGARLVLISDFSGLKDSQQSYLRALGHHCDCVAVRITDPLEESAPSIPDELVWHQTRLRIDGAATNNLTAQLQARTEALQQYFSQAGIEYYGLSVVSDAPLPGAPG